MPAPTMAMSTVSSSPYVICSLLVDVVAWRDGDDRRWNLFAEFVRLKLIAAGGGAVTKRAAVSSSCLRLGYVIVFIYMEEVWSVKCECEYCEEKCELAKSVRSTLKYIYRDIYFSCQYHINVTTIFLHDVSIHRHFIREVVFSFQANQTLNPDDFLFMVVSWSRLSSLLLYISYQLLLRRHLPASC